MKGIRCISHKFSGATCVGVNLNLRDVLAYSRKSLGTDWRHNYVLRLYKVLGVTVHVIQRVLKVYADKVKPANNFRIS